MKELSLDKQKKIIFGTCAGVGKAFGINLILIRILTIFSLYISGGVFLIVYFIATLCMVKKIQLKIFVLIMLLLLPIVIFLSLLIVPFEQWILSTLEYIGSFGRRD